MAKITKNLFRNLQELSKSAFPNEVGGILIGKEIINDFVLFPGEFSRHYVSLNLFNLPIYPNMVGTFHSHPSGALNPSPADLKMFSKTGKFNIIFSMDDFKCYDASGKQIKLEIM